ncbi:hypothetical protein D3C71_1994270 [compost metagenome]
MLAIIVRAVDHHAVELLQMRRHFVPLGGVDEIGPGPGARQRIGQVVFEGIGPAHRVQLGRAAPADAVELARLQGRFHVFIG